MDSWSINLLKEGWCPNLQSKLSTFYTRRVGLIWENWSERCRYAIFLTLHLLYTSKHIAIVQKPRACLAVLCMSQLQETSPQSPAKLKLVNSHFSFLQCSFCSVLYTCVHSTDFGYANQSPIPTHARLWNGEFDQVILRLIFT
jgi:hypothetical protein